MRVGGGAGDVVTDSDRTPWNTRRRDWGGEFTSRSLYIK